MFQQFVEKSRTGHTRKTIPVRMMFKACPCSCWSESRISQLDFYISLRVLRRVQLFCIVMAKLFSGKTMEVSASFLTSLWSWLERFGSVPQKLHKVLLARVSGWYRRLALFSVKNSQGMLSLNYLLPFQESKNKNYYAEHSFCIEWVGLGE